MTTTETDPNEPDPVPVQPDPAPVEPDPSTFVIEPADEVEAGGSTANTAADVALGQHDVTLSGDDEPEPEPED